MLKECCGFTAENEQIDRPHLRFTRQPLYPVRRTQFFALVPAGHGVMVRASETSLLEQNRNVEIFRHGTANKKVVGLMDSVRRMNHLENDWNGYGSERPNELARDISEMILLATPSVRIPNRVAPSAQGGVGIFFYERDRYADIECFNTGEILGTTAIGTGDPDVWSINPTEIRSALKRIGEFLAL